MAVIWSDGRSYAYSPEEASTYDSSFIPLRYATQWGTGDETREFWEPLLKSTGEAFKYQGYDIFVATSNNGNTVKYGYYNPNSSSDSGWPLPITILGDSSLTDQSSFKSFESQAIFVKDRPGHDRRYAIDFSKLSNSLGWHPKETFRTGIRKTVAWYLDEKNFSWDLFKKQLSYLERQG